MKFRLLACAALVGCALGATSATAQSEARGLKPQSSVTSVHSFVEKWQKQILAQNLPVADPMNWGVRNLPKFASFSAERFQLAQQAATVGELEALLASAPVASGTRLSTLMATTPGNISLDAMTVARPTGNVRKTDPTTDPTTYSDLEFTQLNPCRILDSRVSQGGDGPFLNGVSRQVKIGPYPAAGGGYQTGAGAQGGSATSCGLDTLASGSEIDAVMVAVSSFTQTGPGYLTFYSNTAPDPSATVVSMFYTGGPVQTAFVVMPTDAVGPVSSRGISRSANTEVTIDIVGYFAKPKAQAFNCAATALTPNTVTAGTTNLFTGPACPAGSSATSPLCLSATGGTFSLGSGVNDATSGNNGFCAWSNVTASDSSVASGTMCCRVPGR